ncbi:MAG: hypothetical protein ACRD2E_03050 [Terriglobales bacterium]
MDIYTVVCFDKALSVGMVGDFPKRSTGPAQFVWQRGEVVSCGGGAAVVALGEVFDLLAAYTAAQGVPDPLLAPHGFFRSLQPDNAKHAGEFLEAFGPLEVSVGSYLRCAVGPSWVLQRSPDGRPLYSVDLADFWRKHARYLAVAQLWEAAQSGDAIAVHKALEGLVANLKRMLEPAQVGPGANLGSLSRFGEDDPLLLNVNAGEPPSRVEQTLRAMAAPEARGLALRIVLGELNRQAEGRRPAWEWVEDAEQHRPGFRPVFTMTSLWAAIWEMFGWDTMREVTWRICPHCETLFYPPRKDRFYCTHEEQAKASKRNYARRTRAAQKRLRRE